MIVMVERRESKLEPMSSEIAIHLATLRSDIFKHTLRRSLARYAAELIGLEQARETEAPTTAFEDRITESTFHPSHNLPPVFYLELNKALMLLWKQHNDQQSMGDIEDWAKSKSETIITDCQDMLIRLGDAAIPSNADLTSEKMQELQEAFTTATASDEEINVDAIITGLPPVELQDKFDESNELVLRAKVVLLHNMSEHYYTWVDFDGAKRADGHAYSKYAALVYTDIVRYSRHLSPEQRDAALVIYQEFRKNAALNHALSNLLKDPVGLPELQLTKLESVMERLKDTRKERLTELERYKNSAKVKALQEDKRDVMMSDRVKFMPRLDHKTIEAAKKHQAGETLENGEKAQYAMLKNIVRQVGELNVLAHDVDGVDGDSAVPQIMIAMAEGTEDVLALRKELNSDISIVPLFEGEDTVAPEKITQYLETMWVQYNNKEKFQREVNEIFIAGSDLSKEVGQFSALVKVWQAAKAIDSFNKKYDVVVDLKLGTGEAPFRQGGYWDPEAYLPLIKDKTLSDDDQKFLIEKFSDDWKEKLVRKPRGFNWLLEKFPFLNSFTEQSYAAEQTVWKISPLYLKKMKQAAQETHQRNKQQLKEQGVPEIPQSVLEAAAAEQEFYQSVYGKKDQNKSQFGQLLQYCATGLPSPVLRDRAVARAGADGANLQKLFKKLEQPHIDARAIAANTVSGFLFPLFLTGKGSMLEQAKAADNIVEVLDHVDAKELLRQMQVYGAMEPTLMQLLQSNGLEAEAKKMNQEWGKLLACKTEIRAAMLQQELPVDVSLEKFHDTEKQRLAGLLVPGMRELLTEDFNSKYTALAEATINKYQDILANAIQFIANGITDGNTIPRVDAGKYGALVANITTGYSPGM